MLLISVHSIILSLVFLFLHFAIVGYGDGLNDTPNPIEAETPITDLSGQNLGDTSVPWLSYDSTGQPVPSTPPAETNNLNIPDQMLAQAFAADSDEKGNSNQKVPPDRAGPPRGKPALGPPTPANPNLSPWEPGYWPGHPQTYDDIEREDTADPVTGYRQPIRQPEGYCEKGKLFCCRPVLILCYDFYERLPECIPSQQQCCDRTDKFHNGINCRDPRPAKQRQPAKNPRKKPKTQNQPDASNSGSSNPGSGSDPGSVSNPDTEVDTGAGAAAAAILDLLFQGFDGVLGFR